MKSNNAKYIISFLWIALLFTSISSVNARSFLWWNSSDNYLPCASNYKWSDVLYSQWTFSNLWLSSSLVNLDFINNTNNFHYYWFNWQLSWLVWLYNNGDFFQCSTMNNSSSVWSRYTYQYRYNFINVVKDGTTADFYVWRDLTKSYRHISVPTIWYSIYWIDYDMWFPRHWTIIFYDSVNWHTIQLIGDKTLYDRVIYVDPMDSDQNLYVIDYFHKKAWSVHYDEKDILTDYMFWEWWNTDDFLYDLLNYFEVSYTLNDWGTYFWPSTFSQYSLQYTNTDQYWNVQWYTRRQTENAYVWLTFTYTTDLIYQAPDWSFWEVVNTWSSVSDSDIRSYETCINDITTIKNIASLEYACRNTIDENCVDPEFWESNCFSSSDFDRLYQDLLNFDWSTWLQSTKNVSCTNWSIKSQWLYYWSWSWNYSRLFLTANSWSIDPNSIDPVNYCGDYPSSSSEQSWACRIFNIGCSDDFTFGGAYNSIRYYVSPFIQETFWEYERYFMSWYNYLGTANSCSSDMYWKSYSWWNFALLFVVAWLSFTIYSVFKD